MWSYFSPCWACFDREAQCQNIAFKACYSQPHNHSLSTVITIHKDFISGSQSHTDAHTFHLAVAEFNMTEAAIFFLSSFQSGWSHIQTTCSTSAQAALCGETDPTALHTDFQAIWWFAAGIHDTTVHVTGAIAVVTQVICAAATAAGLWHARATRGLCHHHVAKCQELTKQAGQDAVDTAVWVKMSKEVRVMSSNVNKTCESAK